MKYLRNHFFQGNSVVYGKESIIKNLSGQHYIISFSLLEGWSWLLSQFTYKTCLKSSWNCSFLCLSWTHPIWWEL